MKTATGHALAFFAQHGICNRRSITRNNVVRFARVNPLGEAVKIIEKPGSDVPGFSRSMITHDVVDFAQRVGTVVTLPTIANRQFFPGVGIEKG